MGELATKALLAHPSLEGQTIYLQEKVLVKIRGDHWKPEIKTIVPYMSGSFGNSYRHDQECPCSI